MGTPTTFEERCAAGLPPVDALELSHALSRAVSSPSQADATRLLRWALAHRALLVGREGREGASSVEEAVTAHVASSYAALPALAGPLHVYWPHGFLQPRIRSVLHLALELDVLAPRELFLTLQPLLSADDRFDALLRHGEQRALGARQRVAALARGVALAATFVGSLDGVVSGERADAFMHVLEHLYRDRDPVVGGRAAWAVGALAAREPRAQRLFEREPAPGMEARRAMVALTAQWILGEADDAAYVRALREGAGKTDVFVRSPGPARRSRSRSICRSQTL